MRLLLSVLYLSIFIVLGETLKIVVFSPKFAFSHMNYIGNVADTLQMAGNNVTVVQPILVPEIRGTGVVHSKVISIPGTPEMASIFHEMVASGFWESIWSMGLYDPNSVIGPLPMVKRLFGMGCDRMLNQTELIQDLKNENFDLAITEPFDFCGFALFHAIGVTKVVGAHSTGMLEGTALAMGIPVVPSYVTGSMAVSSDSGTMFERIVNLVFTYISYHFQNEFSKVTQFIMNKHYPDAPKIWDMVSEMPFIFTNSEPLIDFPRPSMFNVVDLGGIGLRASQPLDKFWTDILSLRSKNVLFSFGSIAPSSTMPMKMKENIIRVMKKFPNVTFIWKYETPDDGLANGVDNAILTKWSPQNDLLGSGLVSLFVTHGGAGSLMESASSAVPMVVVPLFGDQMRNAKMVERMGYGVAYLKADLFDETLLEAAIRHGLEDEELRQNSRKVAKLLQKRSFSPQEKLVKTIDFLGQFDSLSHLLPRGRHLSYIAYYNIDIFFLLAGMISIVVFAIAKLTKVILCAGTTKVKTQ